MSVCAASCGSDLKGDLLVFVVVPSVPCVCVRVCACHCTFVVFRKWFFVVVTIRAIIINVLTIIASIGDLRTPHIFRGRLFFVRRREKRAVV